LVVEDLLMTGQIGHSRPTLSEAQMSAALRVSQKSHEKIRDANYCRETRSDGSVLALFSRRIVEV
jgi:hypothetical protein